LQEADLVLWIGPELETFLQRPLGNISAQKQISSFQLAGLYWPEREYLQNHDHHHGKDPHLWLDPHNAIVIARALAERLAEANPEAEKFYRANTEQFARDIEVLDKRLRGSLAPVTHRGFAVYHEGYQHFVTRFQLQQLGYVTFSPEQRSGAKHLYQLRNQLKGNAVCLFTEPYYDRDKASELADELGLRLGVLDPIGGENTQSYKELLNDMANALLACLSQA
jgi:zinc transport system substrate-binding protein